MKIDEKTIQALAYAVTVITISIIFIGSIAFLKFLHDINMTLFYTVFTVLVFIFVVMLVKEAK